MDFRISGYVDQLVRRLHKEYPWTERSGLARIVKSNWYYTMTDIRFAEQENSTGNTEMTKEGISSLVETLFEEDPKSLSEYCCWIHSHHTMWCFWSGTDHEAKASFAQDGNTKFFFSVVTAYAGDDIKYKCALDIYKPVRLEFDIPVSVEEYDPKSTIAEFELMMKAIENLEKKRDEKLALVEAEWVVNEDNVVEVIGILNVEDCDDNRNMVIDLLQEQNAEWAERLREMYIKEFEDNKDETVAYFQGDCFEKRIKELKDCIIKYKPATAYRSGAYDWDEHNKKVGEKLKRQKKWSDTPLWDALPTRSDAGEDDDYPRDEEDEKYREIMQRQKKNKGLLYD